jgi:hypothetical protein
MIRIQVVEKSGADLKRAMTAAMRSGKLRTFQLQKRGRKVTHVRAPGYMNWTSAHGVITGEILSPQKPLAEWDFLSKFVGRLAAKYPELIQNVCIQFPEKASNRRKRRK